MEAKILLDEFQKAIDTRPETLVVNPKNITDSKSGVKFFFNPEKGCSFDPNTTRFEESHPLGWWASLRLIILRKRLIKKQHEKKARDAAERLKAETDKYTQPYAFQDING